MGLSYCIVGVVTEDNTCVGDGACCRGADLNMRACVVALTGCAIPCVNLSRCENAIVGANLTNVCISDVVCIVLKATDGKLRVVVVVVNHTTVDQRVGSIVAL